MLYELLDGVTTLSVIGMCKNAGKTTVLNALISECDSHGDVIGLTSIGRDGERSDLVTNTAKPEIFVSAGTVVATAETLMRHGDVSREILAATGIPTPMGEIVVFRARSSGFVQIGGASITDHQKLIRDMLLELGCTRVLIDGAISRKSLGNPSLCDAVVLSSGASYDPDVGTTVADTVHFARLFSLPICGAVPENSRFTAVFDDGKAAADDIAELVPALKRGAETLIVRGAFTDSAARELISVGKLLANTRLAAEDASRLLLKPASFDKLSRISRGFAVLKGSRLIAVTVNPFSVYGTHYNRTDFRDRVTEALKAAGVDVPVTDVKYA